MTTIVLSVGVAYHCRGGRSLKDCFVASLLFRSIVPLSLTGMSVECSPQLLITSVVKTTVELIAHCFRDRACLYLTPNKH